MVLVLVLGVSASFAADSNQTDMQASDESAAIVNDTLTTSGLNEQTINKEDCLGTTNEESYSSSNDDILEAGEGSFTDLETEIRKGGTITLTKNYKYDSSKDSAYVNGIVVNETVTINGNGKTIDGSNLARTFYVTASNVVIKNLNFINGYSTGYGNNIRWTGNYGLLTDCTFKYSLSWTPNSLISGAVHFGGAYGVITNCLFDRNVANYTSSTPDGGGLSVHGTQNTVKNCNFTNNYARGSGGAIHQQGSYNTILDCYFYNNTCAEFGGAVLLWSTNHNVINCTFVSNKNIGGSTGGALATYYGTANVTGCDFRDNSAKVHGGAISITSSGSMVNVKDCNFTNNRAGSNGGALYLTLGYSTVVNCNFESNTAANGGASFVSGSMNTIEECEFKSNTATATGGAVYVSGDSSTITDSTFTSNSDTKGSGALYVASGKSTYLDDLTYTTSSDTVNTTGVTQLSNVLYVAPTAKGNKDGSNANNAANWTYAYSHIANGGTIYFTQGTYTNIVSQTISKSLNLIGLGTVTVDLQQNGRAFTISSPYTTVDNIDFKNGKITGSGGALYWSGAYGVLKNSNFEYNYASTDGGAVEWTGIYGTITDCTFNHNQADDVGWTGAAVMIASSYTKVLNSRFTYNTAPGDSGNNAGDGTLVLAGNYNIVDNCYFAHNSAANDGSALGTQSKHNIIKNSVFEHNYAIKTTSTKQRGTLNVLEGGSNITIDNCTFFNNTNVHGGAIYVLTSSGTDTTITGCIFIKNNATYGGAIYYADQKGKLENCTFEQNTATYGGSIYWAGNQGIINDITVTGSTAVNGSAIYVVGGRTIELSNSTFTNNNAQGEGIVFIENNTKITLEDNEFKSNIGDAITTVGEVTSDLFFIKQGATGSGLIESDPTNWNYAINHINDGGKIVFLANTYTDLINQMINKTVILEARSGVIISPSSNGRVFTINASDVVIKGFTFQNARFTGNGGAIYVSSGNVEISDSLFKSNQATNGGAIYIASGAKATIISSNFTSNSATSGGAIYCAGNGSSIESSRFESNTATTGNNLHSTSTVTVTNSVLKDHFTLTKTGTISYGTDEFIGGTFASNAPSSVTLYLGTTSYGIASVASNKFSKTLSLLPVGTYTISFKDANSNTYTFTDNSFTVNRLSTVYISPSGTGSGNSASSPTTWDKVADIITSTGTVVFATGNYSNFYGKTINQGWTLQAASGATPELDASNNGRIFTVSANNVKISGLTFKNGKATDSYGSAIHWIGTGGSITNSVLTANTGRPITTTSSVSISNSQLKDQVSLTKSNINWGAKETVKATFTHSAPSTVTVMFNGASQGSFSVSSKVATAEINFVNPSTQAVGSYVVTDLKNILKEVL